MRGTIAYYLLLLYITVMFKPFIPILRDSFSHTFTEAIHIATVHALYGSNHLQKEIFNEPKPNSYPNTANVEITVLVHFIINELNFNSGFGKLLKTFPYNKPNTLTKAFISKVGPPPKRLMV